MLAKNICAKYAIFVCVLIGTFVKANTADNLNFDYLSYLANGIGIELAENFGNTKQDILNALSEYNNANAGGVVKYLHQDMLDGKSCPLQTYFQLYSLFGDSDTTFKSAFQQLKAKIDQLYPNGSPNELIKEQVDLSGDLETLLHAFMRTSRFALDIGAEFVQEAAKAASIFQKDVFLQNFVSVSYSNDSSLLVANIHFRIPSRPFVLCVDKINPATGDCPRLVFPRIIIEFFERGFSTRVDTYVRTFLYNRNFLSLVPILLHSDADRFLEAPKFRVLPTFELSEGRNMFTVAEAFSAFSSAGMAAQGIVERGRQADHGQSKNTTLPGCFHVLMFLTHTLLLNNTESSDSLDRVAPSFALCFTRHVHSLLSTRPSTESELSSVFSPYREFWPIPASPVVAELLKSHHRIEAQFFLIFAISPFSSTHEKFEVYTENVSTVPVDKVVDIIQYMRRLPPSLVKESFLAIRVLLRRNKDALVASNRHSVVYSYLSDVVTLNCRSETLGTESARSTLDVIEELEDFVKWFLASFSFKYDSKALQYRWLLYKLRYCLSTVKRHL